MMVMKALSNHPFAQVDCCRVQIFQSKQPIKRLSSWQQREQGSRWVAFVPSLLVGGLLIGIGGISFNFWPAVFFLLTLFFLLALKHCFSSNPPHNIRILPHAPPKRPDGCWLLPATAAAAAALLTAATTTITAAAMPFSKTMD
jgi:hypothetical protein